MINTREFEIRDEALSLTVAAYQLISELAELISLEVRTKLTDDSFLVSSLIAEAFRTSYSVTSEEDLKLALSKLIDLKAEALRLELFCPERPLSLDNFVHLAEELQVELTELLAAMKQLNAETFSPKIELACI
jgi:hypothetical protein